QTSKRTMCGPAWESGQGRLIWLGERAKKDTQPPHRGSGGSMYTMRSSSAACGSAPLRGKRTQNGKPQDVAGGGQPGAREGWAGRLGVAERPVVPWKPVMPVEGRSLSSRRTQDVAWDLEIGQPINSEQRSETADGVTRKSEG